MRPASPRPRPFTGKHMAAVLVLFFGTIITVNFTMARYATSTFGGIVVENSYVASQKFNGWLDEAAQERELGWDAVTTWRPDGRLALALKNVPQGAVVTAIARHPLGHMADRPMRFTATPNGTYLSDGALPDGRWILRLAIEADGRQWRREERLQ
ncbi:hypothetical protein D6851_06690 [Altericroceibacterium spongiae]|uniref:Nitrogen fixation protein FixH n=1 Tax=Altericroceibacterium spongiae TaxID=2320269 RepID=A0A420EM91_9SPHN|nr:FixH family protein [Altericroceibacterium spongiae]RKF21714.1 hypothetical protein D6851_06690 [Altericroceibacterium spongiae]